MMKIFFYFCLQIFLTSDSKNKKKLFPQTLCYSSRENFGIYLSSCDILQIGPGTVHLHFTFPFGKGVFVQTLTPIEPLHQVMAHKLYTTWIIPNWIGRFFLLGEAIQVLGFGVNFQPLKSVFYLC